MKRTLAILGLLVFSTLSGCGTSRWTDTARTATEQMLISDAMDRAVSEMDLRALAGKKVFLDSTPMARVTDSPYLISSLRQHMLASGCVLKDKRVEADYVVEARAGAVGTDKHEMFLGIPSISVPIGLAPTPVPSIPEVKFIKKTEQRAITKLALFAYNAKTGRPVWQSGARPVTSKAKDVWIAGAGPFQRGSIYEGTQLAGEKIALPLAPPDGLDDRSKVVDVAEEAFFREPTPKSPDQKLTPEKQVQTALAKKAPANEASKKKAPTAVASQKNLPNGSTKQEVVPVSHSPKLQQKKVSDNDLKKENGPSSAETTAKPSSANSESPVTSETKPLSAKIKPADQLANETSAESWKSNRTGETLEPNANPSASLKVVEEPVELVSPWSFEKPLPRPKELPSANLWSELLSGE